MDWLTMFAPSYIEVLPNSKPPIDRHWSLLKRDRRNKCIYHRKSTKNEVRTKRKVFWKNMLTTTTGSFDFEVAEAGFTTFRVRPWLRCKKGALNVWWKRAYNPQNLGKVDWRQNQGRIPPPQQLSQREGGVWCPAVRRKDRTKLRWMSHCHRWWAGANGNGGFQHCRGSMISDRHKKMKTKENRDDNSRRLSKWNT